MSTIFFTGFPGFLGSALIKKMLARTDADQQFVCLIQSKFRAMAEKRVDLLESESSEYSGRIRLVEGDITQNDLGLGDQWESIAEDTVEIFHLAAVYDLGVSREVGMKVNVEGTRNTLSFAQACPNLNRYQYVSTCYVSGRYPGTFTEDHLEEGQRFNNYYEETKYLAEVDVQSAQRSGLPVTIYRPGIVTGDSKSGATQKYDGPYYILQWLLRQPKVAFLPVVGKPGEYTVNIVPSDYVIDAMDYLASKEESLNKVYQLCDPQALTVDEIIKAMSEETGRKIVRIPLPLGVAKGSLKFIPGVKQLMKIEPEAVNYFSHPTKYSCEHTLSDLSGSGIQCPHYDEYLDVLVDFMKKHPDVSSKAMV
jgi:thioester reductase-like protein